MSLKLHLFPFNIKRSMLIIQDQTDPEEHPQVGPQFGAAETASDSEFTGGGTLGAVVFLDLKRAATTR
jgi:hypothetical protein